jgi:hypothetical protein
MTDLTKKKPRHPANPDAPKFTPELWKRSNGDVVLANCIAYAYSGSKPDGTNVVSDESVPQLGYTAGYLAIDTDMVSKRNLPALMKKEGITWVGKKPLASDPNKFEVPPIKEGHYVIGLYLQPTPKGKIPEGKTISFGYHFVRQDADGGWSDKMADEHVARAFEPAPDGGYKPLTNNYLKGYYFAGYGYVPKRGIDAGIEEKLIPGILYGLAKDYDVCEGLAPIINHLGNGGDKIQGAWQLSNIAETLKKYNIPEAQEAFETCVAPYIKIVRPNFVPKSAARE